MYWGDNTLPLDCSSTCGGPVTVAAWSTGDARGAPYVTSVVATGPCRQWNQTNTGSTSGGGLYYAKTEYNVFSGPCNTSLRLTWTDGP